MAAGSWFSTDCKTVGEDLASTGLGYTFPVEGTFGILGGKCLTQGQVNGDETVKEVLDNVPKLVPEVHYEVAAS